MANFCGKCGTPIDPETGLCPKCDALPNEMGNAANASQPSAFDIEKARAEQAVKKQEEKAKHKAEKKEAWNRAKKRYAEDKAAKKAMLKQSKKERKKAKWDAMTTGKKAGRILLKIALVLLLVGAIVVGSYFGIKSLFPAADNGGSNGGSSQTTPTNPTTPDNGEDNFVYNPPTGTMPDGYKSPEINADEYYQQNSEVIATIPAAGAGRTEQETYTNLTSRGFTNPITTEYTMDGTYIEEREISATGTEKHPVYTTTFTTESGSVWTITEINGAIFAIPASYNYENSSYVPIVFAETDKVIGYDGTLNKFYETKPAESVLDVKVIARIDATTLNTLNVEEVE